MSDEFKNKKYEKLWKEVDSLDAKSLPQSALAIVERIYNVATSEDNKPQIVKTIIYKLKYFETLKDSETYKFDFIKTEIAKSKFPLSNILHSILADMYFAYYNQNNWQINERTNVSNPDSSDITTWTLDRIIQEVEMHYSASLFNEPELCKIPILDYIDILDTAKDSEKLRPYLFDFLAHRAIEFFVNDISTITKPKDDFQIDKDIYFSNYKDFASHTFLTPNTNSPKYRTITLMQRLLLFYQNSLNHEALIDMDLKRLDYVRSNFIYDYSDSLYLKALSELEKQFEFSIVMPIIRYRLAEYYNQKSYEYVPHEKEEFRWFRKKALDICNQVIASKQKSEGVTNCKALANNILRKDLQITVEQINVPQKPFLAKIEFANMEKVYFRIIRCDYMTDRNLRRTKYNEELLKEYLAMEVVEQWSETLPTIDDYLHHSIEIAMPELKSGYYVVLAAMNEDFSLTHNIIAYERIHISNIGYVSRTMNDGSLETYVFNRSTGMPLKNAQIETYLEQYNYSTREYNLKKDRTFVCDENGCFTIPAILATSNVYSKTMYFKIVSQDETYYADEYLYQYRNYEKEVEKLFKSFLFTDRSIYRPGQTIYFKGILISNNDKNPTIIANKKINVSFFDYNNKKLASIELLTNSYGSYSGTFTIPNDVLTGQVRIEDNYSSVYLSVEEYKRPKFEVAFLPVKDVVKLGEKVKIKGKATAYAGNSISDASVKYRVVRTPYFPYRHYWFWMPNYNLNTVEIMNGTLTTDNNGEFEIVFDAIPDKTILPEYIPTFRYEITADVTDLNGETHSNSYSVEVSYKALFMEIKIPDVVLKHSEHNYAIKTFNILHESVATQGKFKVYKLKSNKRLIRQRFWQLPEIKNIDSATFDSRFPYDMFDNELDKSKWEKETLIEEVVFNTPSDSTILLNKLSELNPGNYVIEALVNDSLGNTTNFKHYFTLIDDKSSTNPVNEFFWYYPLQVYMETGGTASFIIGSAKENARVLFQIEHDNNIKESKWISLDKEQKRIDIPVIPEYTGNFVVHLLMISENRIYQKQQTIFVTDSSRKLNIEFQSFRNKLEPGQSEQWNIKITGNKGEAVMAEFLASMYDASLDAFRPNYWNFDFEKYYYSNLSWNRLNFGNTKSFAQFNTHFKPIYYQSHAYNKLNWFGWNMGNHYYMGGYPAPRGATMRMEYDEAPVEQAEATVMSKTKNGDSEKPAMPSKEDLYVKDSDKSGESNIDFSDVKIRSNFNETAFFYPHLVTDSLGNVIVNFMVPESLTKWKVMGLAHTKDLKHGMTIKNIVTQKKLMLQSNPTRFFREGDSIIFPVKLVNLSDETIHGEIVLQLFDAVTLKPIDNICMSGKAIQTFTIEKGLSRNYNWQLYIPETVQAITCRVVAKSNEYSDGEEMLIPVLSNRMLVTETLPLNIRGNETKTFAFQKLINSNSSTTLQNHKLVFEFTSNPVWYAIQSFPYLMEYPYECSEQLFSRLYALKMAQSISDANPSIQKVFSHWKNLQPSALLSNLEKNQELKSLLIEETPWLLDANSETANKKHLAELFEPNVLTSNIQIVMKKLSEQQLSNGAWPWFAGMPDDRYITQYIFTGLSRLKHLGVVNSKTEFLLDGMMNKAIKYLDARINEDYAYVKKHYAKTMDNQHIGYNQIYYLYSKSILMNQKNVDDKNNEAFDYYVNQAVKYWTKFNNYGQSMIALALHRLNHKSKALEIIKSLKENAILNEEMGMYWKNNVGGYYWYDSKVETQAMIIEAFDEIAKDTLSVEEQQIWLLKQKQTHSWATTKSSVDACYALTMRGTEIEAGVIFPEIKVGNQTIDVKSVDNNVIEAGTGYIKQIWTGNDIDPSFGTIEIKKKNKGIAWGAMYWQYFEQLDKISTHATPLQLEKKLYIETNTDNGKLLVPVDKDNFISVGDKIVVRIVLRTDRDMEYVHLKDMRAAAFEPVNVISRYKYQDGLGYYESTRDAATNFFISYLPKGDYVFEYSLIATHKGSFSNGVATIQCMYAPEFTSHSEGIQIQVK